MAYHRRGFGPRHRTVERGRRYRRCAVCDRTRLCETIEAHAVHLVPDVLRYGGLLEPGASLCRVCRPGVLLITNAEEVAAMRRLLADLPNNELPRRPAIDLRRRRVAGDHHSMEG